MRETMTLGGSHLPVQSIEFLANQIAKDNIKIRSNMWLSRIDMRDNIYSPTERERLPLGRWPKIEKLHTQAAKWQSRKIWMPVSPSLPQNTLRESEVMQRLTKLTLDRMIFIHRRHAFIQTFEGTIASQTFFKSGENYGSPEEEALFARLVAENNLFMSKCQINLSSDKRWLMGSEMMRLASNSKNRLIMMSDL